LAIGPSGGAGGAAGANLIAMFAQWGATQLILAAVSWVVIFRYRFLTPFALGLMSADGALRLVAGLLKPLDVAAPPPGAYATWVLFPLCLLMLVWSLRVADGPAEPIR
jgi:hypothetical protein